MGQWTLPLSSSSPFYSLVSHRGCGRMVWFTGRKHPLAHPAQLFRIGTPASSKYPQNPLLHLVHPFVTLSLQRWGGHHSRFLPLKMYSPGILLPGQLPPLLIILHQILQCDLHNISS